MDAEIQEPKQRLSRLEAFINKNTQTKLVTFAPGLGRTKMMTQSLDSEMIPEPLIPS